jgi:hypothetical protein
MTLGTARTGEWFLGTLKTFYIIALQGVCRAASQDNGSRTIPFRSKRQASFPAGKGEFLAGCFPFSESNDHGGTSLLH